MITAKDRFIKELRKLLSKYPIVPDTTGSDAHYMNERRKLQIRFRNSEQYKLNMLLVKWSKSDAHVTDEDIVRTYFGCVLGHFKIPRYYKK